MAKRVKFLKADLVPLGRRQWLEAKEGSEATLTDEQADAAVSAGLAKVIADKTPSKREKAAEEVST
jgi:hypothetical protein